MVNLERTDFRGEFVPGMAERAINHAIRNIEPLHLEATKDQLNDLTWEQIYDCSPISSLIDHKLTTGDITKLFAEEAELRRQLTVKTMNEWARALSDKATGKHQQVAIPFWRR